MIDVEKLVQTAAQAGMSDIHLVYGIPPKGRLDGKLVNIIPEALTDNDCEAIAAKLAGPEYQKMAVRGEQDFALHLAGERVRINLFRQQGHVSAALRILANKIPELGILGLPPVVNTFPTIQKGIILVTGETGSGKSTTMAAILDRINHTRQDHIITLEDPIEYIYQPDQCVINQREIGNDTESYSNGLRAILREDPDVILIGEMRDAETIETALTAAQTGHLVLATLHTNSAPESIDRIIGVFTAEKQPQIRMDLSMTIQSIISQQLLVRKGGKGRVLACECMVATNAIRNLIREGKTPQMYSSMLSSANVGSITMDNSLINLVVSGKIEPQTAVNACNDKEYVMRKLGLIA